MWKLGSDVVTLIGALSTEYPTAVNSRILYFPERNRKQSRFRIGTSEPQIQDSQIGRVLQGHLDQTSIGAEPSAHLTRPCPSAPGTLSARYGVPHLSHSSGPQNRQGRGRCKTGNCPHRSLHSCMDLRRIGSHLWNKSMLVC